MRAVVHAIAEPTRMLRELARQPSRTSTALTGPPARLRLLAEATRHMDASRWRSLHDPL